MRRLLSVILVALCGTAIGCATTGGMRSAPITDGVARTYPGSVQTVLKVARESLVEAGLHIEETNKVDDRTWMVIGRKDATAFSLGEFVRIVVAQNGSKGSTVRVLTERRSKINVTAKGDYSDTIFSSMDLKLK